MRSKSSPNSDSFSAGVIGYKLYGGIAFIAYRVGESIRSARSVGWLNIQYFGVRGDDLKPTSEAIRYLSRLGWSLQQMHQAVKDTGLSLVQIVSLIKTSRGGADVN